MCKWHEAAVITSPGGAVFLEHAAILKISHSSTSSLISIQGIYEVV